MNFEKLFTALANLPVARVADEVTLSVMDGIVTTLSSDTGSGKTLYQSTHLAEHLDERVVVMMPRRFLAVNAAETVAELSGTTVGGIVGYAVGKRGGDQSCFSDETKLLFVTNGYALASGLVQTANIVVLDEVHETSMDLSIIRALLYRRLSQGESIKLLEMSATMNATRQAQYWNGVSKTQIFQVEGKTFNCDVRHRPASSVEDEVFNLIEEGRRGILVFRPGVGEVQETAKIISEYAVLKKVEVQVAQIYGEMSYAERRKSTEAPKEGTVKVLIGTNVVESGANIPWLDAGVTCGTGKENSVRPETGATVLELIDLPRWRLSQQEGRVKRFRDGVFILCSPKSFTDREQATRPEIERLALTELVMHCAGFGLRTHELNFDYAPDAYKVQEAEEKLVCLGLINKECELTPAGTSTSGLPVGPETGAMLWHASQIGCLPQMLPLAAVIEVGGLRKDFRYGHLKDSTSDYLDSLLAFKQVYETEYKDRKAVLEENNIGFKRFDAACDLVQDLARKMNSRYSYDLEPVMDKLKECILAGSLNKLFMKVGFRGEIASIRNRMNSYRIAQGSAAQYVPTGNFVSGDLRVITPRNKDKRPFTVLEKVSIFDLEQLRAVSKVRPEIWVEKNESLRNYFGDDDFDTGYSTLYLFGKYPMGSVRNKPVVEKPKEPVNANPPTLADLVLRYKR